MEVITPADLELLVKSAKNSFRNALASGRATASIIAVNRRRWEIMDEAWRNDKKTVIRFFGGNVPIAAGARVRWYEKATTAATEQVDYEHSTDDRFMRWFDKKTECALFARSVERFLTNFLIIVKDK